MNNFKYIKLERKGKICICTLNRPEKKNALSEALRTEILTVLDDLREDDRISTVIFYGGKEFFSTGFDKDEIQAAIVDPEKTQRLKDTSLLFHKKFFEYPKLTIAAISGYALGGGFDLAVLCHLRVASKTSIFGHPEIGFGAVPLFFPYMSLMGRGKALELLLNTARKEDFIDAEEAYHLNIINKLVEPENVLNEAINMAKKISKSPKLTVSSLLKVNNAFFDRYKAYENEVDIIVSNMTKQK